MKLTQKIRKAFVDQAMADVPLIDYDEQIKALMRQNPEIVGLMRRRDVQIATRATLRSRLERIAGAVTSRAELARVLPRFAAYLPENVPAGLAQLPEVAGLADDFAAAGWRGL